MKIFVLLLEFVLPWQEKLKMENLYLLFKQLQTIYNYAYLIIMLQNQCQMKNQNNMFKIHQIIHYINLHLIMFMIKIVHKNKYTIQQQHYQQIQHYKVIIQLLLHMVKLVQVKHIQCMVFHFNLILINQVLYHVHYIVYLHIYK